MERKRGERKKQTGIVVSDKMKKTIVVQVERLTRHPAYGRMLKKYTKFYVHDEKNGAKTGDRVVIQETRPLSRLKRWRLLRIVRN